jgi:cytochrome c biogenesis protein
VTETLSERHPAPAPTPPPRLPEILGPWETAVLFWRWLRRMSTALLLLFALAVGSMIGTFIPQEPVIATTVADWRSGAAGPGEAVARVFDALSFFDVFGSLWFLGITVLLFTSLTACLVPRIRAFLRTARRPPPRGRNLDRLSNSVLLRTGRAPEEALAAAERALRRRRFRVRRCADEAAVPQMAAERGHWREGGSLVFHLAFYLLLIGVVVGQGFGFTGQVNVVEGDPPILDTRLTYGLNAPGRWFGLEDHRGFAVRLDEFTVDYHRNDTPAEFRSDISILEGDEVVETGSVRVNHPFRYDGMNIYQIRFGMAPRIIVRAGDQELFNERVAMSQQAGGMWTGVAKVSTREGSQIALDLVLVPDADVVEQDGEPRIVNRSPRPENPTVFASLYVGELGLERPVPASEFDRSGGAAAELVLPQGLSQPVADGQLTVEFADLGEWSGFQVAHQPGRGILVSAALLVLAGLIPSLYSYRRRVWAEALPADDGAHTELRLAGVALQRHPRFAEAFAELATEVSQALDADEDRSQRR